MIYKQNHTIVSSYTSMLVAAQQKNIFTWYKGKKALVELKVEKIPQHYVFNLVSVENNIRYSKFIKKILKMKTRIKENKTSPPLPLSYSLITPIG